MRIFKTYGTDAIRIISESSYQLARDTAASASRAPISAADRENLAGIVERVTFHNEDSGFCVLRLKARGQRDLITVVGHAAAIVPVNSFRRAAGGSTIGRTGCSFAPTSCAQHRPPPPKASRYLASGMIKGIGPIYAKKLVKMAH